MSEFQYAVLGSQRMDCIGRMVMRPSGLEIASQLDRFCDQMETIESKLSEFRPDPISSPAHPQLFFREFKMEAAPPLGRP